MKLYAFYSDSEDSEFMVLARNEVEALETLIHQGEVEEEELTQLRVYEVDMNETRYLGEML